MTEQIRLGAAERQKVRKAITSHQDWHLYKKANGVSIDSMSAEALLTACSALGIDVPGVIAAEGEEHHKPRPWGPARVGDLKRRLAAVTGGTLGDKDAKFVGAILDTIQTKQDNHATEKQYRVIERIVLRAEAGLDGDEQQQEAELKRIEQQLDAAEAQGKPFIPVTPPPASDNPAAQLAALIQQMAGSAINPEQVARIVDERINAALSNIPTVRIEIRKGADTQTIEGHHHPRFTDLLKWAGARMVNGYAPNIWLAGPAGSGKTHAAKMTAKALGVAFHFNGALSMPHELLGFIDAGGTYHRTPFREAYEFGGVYLFDEVDGSDNSALLALNAALANGVATFPDGQVHRHADCVIIGTANTWGLGATADYVGRSKIDAAFLSRFPVRIAWEYDTALEVAVSGHENFARRVIAARERARTAGIKVLIDPRASQAGAAGIAAGFNPEQVAEMTYLANLTAEQRRTVEGR